MKKKFLGVYHPSVILTYIGVLISIFGIFFVDSLYLATILLMLAGLC
ncbi:MAG: CDP-diacylglycerol--serine O-phosphatidyltransferase, partial [Lachnoanaerobaculum sp.]|nr:CDP-diacylglycerol--serine O-phosphatidyltransferase [Lachnoanaerobaculum sp.]